MNPRIAPALLLLALTASATALEPADIKIDAWNLTLNNQTLAIDPPTLLDGKYDFALADGEPGWRGPTLLPGPAWAYAALHPDTLVITLASDPNTKLTAGTDFALDPMWACVTAKKDSRYPPGTKVHAEYKYGLSRLDLVEKSPDGKLHLVKGTDDKDEPLLPKTTPGNTPLFSVYLPNGITALSKDNLNIIDPAYDGVPPVTGADHLKDIKAKLAAGKPVTFVCLGDSITEQHMKDFRDKQGSYVDRFSAWLKTAYPKSTVLEYERGKPIAEKKDNQIIVLKAGVGGDDTIRALKRLDRDVFSAKPDVVTVMLGVNDENRKTEGDNANSVPVADYKENLAAIVDKIQAAGAVAVLMTPSMKNLNWSGTVGNMADYAQAMRDVAAAKKVTLVDNFRAWQLVPKTGYNYMVLLGNCINHPIDLGHDLFFKGLKSAFTQ